MHKVNRIGGRLLFLLTPVLAASCATAPESRGPDDVLSDALGGGVWYRDADEDGWGHPESSIRAPTAPEGFTDVSGDCDDDDPAVHPNTHEVLNGRDDDCDGETDPSPR